MNNTKNNLIVGMVCAVILVIGLITYLIYSNKGTNETKIEDISSVNSVQEQKMTNTSEDSESASTEIGKTVEESEKDMEENIAKQEANSVDNDNLIDTKKSAETATNTTNTTSKNEVENETEKSEENKNVEPEFCAPIKGEIIREFASDSLVYSNTLQEWITHNGIDIKADKTSVVSSAANGTVYAIKNDPRYGLTVIINHDGGYQTVYSNLLTAEFVVEGEKVEAGQTIGTVGNSASFEISDDYHLHFEVLKDNKSINPTTCINF